MRLSVVCDSFLQGSEKEKPLIRGRSCLKVVDDGACENDSDGLNRKVKKVRFSPENELFEFTKSIAKRGCRRKSRMNNSCLIVENDCSVELKQRAAKSSPVRVTRSQGLQLLDGGDAEKKVAKRGLNGNDRVDKFSDNEVRVTTRRALRNREMQDEGLRESEGLIEGLRKSERQRNRGSAKGIEDVPQSKQIGEEPQGAFRRSKRNAVKKDTGLVNEDVGKNENNNGGKLGRKQALSEVKASELEMDEVRCAENGVALATGDIKEVGVITRRSLRHREITVDGKKEREDDNAGLRRSGRQSKQGPLGSHEVLQSQDILEEPKKELRRSKRNVTNAKDTVTFDENKNSGKVRLGRNQIKLAVKTCKQDAAELKIAEDSFASSNGSNGENRACTKRLLRNKKVAVSKDKNEGLKKMGEQTSMRNDKSGEEGPQNKQIEEELSKGLRRSKRTATKMDDSQYLYQVIGKSKMVRKEQKTRSQFAMSVEASILEAMPETEIAASEKNEVGKEPAKATIRSSPQNSMMPLLDKATKEMEASPFGAMSETETTDESRLEVFIQVEEPTSISPRSSSFNNQFETESAAEIRLEVVNQVEERTGASPRRATGQKSETTLLENVGNVHKDMNQNLSSHSTSNASLEVEVIKDDDMPEANGLRISRHKTVMFYCNPSIDEEVNSSKTVANSELRDDSSKSFEEHKGTVAEEMRTSRRNASKQDRVNSSDETGRIHNATVNAAVEKESCNKKSTPAETSSQQLRVGATRDDKIIQPVGNDKDAGNKQPWNISESRNMAFGVSLAEDITKINEQCTLVALHSGAIDTETTKEPANTEPLVDVSCLEGNESEETRHKTNQVSPNNVGDRTEVEEVKIPQLVTGVEYSCPDLVDLRTDTEGQIVDIPVTESKGFAEMVKISIEVNVENSLDDSEVANLAEQEPSEDFNVDRDSNSIEANSTIACCRSNGQLYLTG